MIRSALSFLLLGVGGLAHAQVVFTESEPNDTRATADLYNGIQDVPGDGMGSRLNGVANGADVDRFQIGVAGTEFLQSNQVIVNRDRSTGGLYGQSLTAAGTRDPNSDVLVQGTTPFFVAAGSVNRFFTVGTESHAMDYGISGIDAAYEARYSRTPISFNPGAIPTFYGAITITAGSTTIDSDIALIGNPFGSGALTPSILKTNNDAAADTLGSRIVADYAFGGEFFLAVSDVNLVTGVLPDADEFARAPNDPRTHLFDDPNVLAASSFASVSIPITITDAIGQRYTTTYAKSGFGVGTYSFRVLPAPVPEPATFAALGLGALALLRRRRRG